MDLDEIQKKWPATYTSYVIGFSLSLLLTFVAYFFVWMHFFTRMTLIYTIAGLAVIQAVIQLLFFLHLGKESKPRWETAVFFFMVMVLLIIAIGSLWIMYNLNTRVMQ